MKKLLYLSFCCLMGFFTACISDKPNETAPEPLILNGVKGVLISNEGAFQFGTASVTYYNPADSSIVPDLFESINGRKLGDVCQSMHLYDQKIYLVVNNSSKVEVVDANTFQSKGTINNLRSPRYFQPINKSKAYVTDLYADAISIVDPNTLQKTGSIACAGWTEQLLQSYGKAYVTNCYRKKVYVINTATDQVVDSISVAYGGNSICEDKEGMIWVLCSGDKDKQEIGGLFRIDPKEDTVLAAFPFANENTNGSRLCINGRSDTLFFLQNGVQRMAINDAALPASAFIPKGSHLFYGLGIHPDTKDIYVSDAIDYTQKGKVFRYSAQGNLLYSFTAGIIPADFYFVR